jgi:pimeloyl-ACP methyl ester carboxylesterase
VDIADGLRLGETWPTLDARKPAGPTLVMVAPDLGGTSESADTTALRGDDRAAVRRVADAFVELDGGHCLHRDQPELWLRTILDFAG